MESNSPSLTELFDRLLDEPEALSSWLGHLARSQHPQPTEAQLAFLRAMKARVDDETRRTGDLDELRLELGARASLDLLTGLLNRPAFSRETAFAIQRARRDGRRVALARIDIEHFGLINGQYGREMGDAVLKAVARRLRSRLGCETPIARLGADEYGVLLPEPWVRGELQPRLDELARIIERPMELDGRAVSIAVRIGCSAYPEPAADADTLIDQAGRALRARPDRGLVGMYTGSFDRALLRQLHVRTRLEAALAHSGGVTVAFQPKFDPQRRLRGAEALARWEDPELGAIEPREFIAVAEQSGLIEQLGRRVLEATCRWIAESQATTGRVIPIAVNISGRHLVRPDFVDEVVDILSRFAVDPALLEMEITESALIESFDNAREKLARLRTAGVRFAVDDFGTGYSSLRYLKQLPIDALKIDKSFVDQMVEDEEDAAIVQGTIALAHGLGMRAIAEGVETQEQLLFLKAFRCDLMQGYLLGRPVDGQVLRELTAAACRCPSEPPLRRRLSVFGPALDP